MTDDTRQQIRDRVADIIDRHLPYVDGDTIRARHAYETTARKLREILALLDRKVAN